MDDRTFNEAVDLLAQSDRDLAMIVTRYGLPTPWRREPGFATLIRIILEQQVSLASAKVAFDRLSDSLGEITPPKLIQLSDEELKRVGFSRQKTRYARELATAILDKNLDLRALEQLDSATVRQKLTAIKGIGDWTADMYLMMALGRTDIFPAKDLAVAIAIKEIKQLDTRPSISELTDIAAAWQPYRAIATMLLWHYYLNRK